MVRATKIRGGINEKTIVGICYIDVCPLCGKPMGTHKGYVEVNSTMETFLRGR